VYVLKRIGKILFVALLLIGLIATTALLYATSEPGSRRISAAVRDAIREQTGFVIAFSKIDIGVLPPRLTLRGITAWDTEGRVACAIEEAELAPDVLELVGGALVIEEVYLGAPRCRVQLSGAAIETLRSNTAKKAADKPTRLDLSAVPRFEVFALSDGRIEATIDDPSLFGVVHAVVEGLNLDVTGDADAIEIRGLVGGASARWTKGGATVDERLEQLELRVALSESGVDVRYLVAKIGGAELRARDAYIPVPVWPNGPRVADLSLAVQLEELGRLPLPLPALQGRAGFAGQVSVRMGANGKPELHLRGRADLKSGKVNDFVVGDVNGIVSLSPQGVSFSEVVVRAAEGVVRLDGDLAFDDALTIDATADFEDLELGHLLAAMTLKGAQVTQRMTGTSRIRGRLRPLSLDLQNRIAVKDHTAWSAGFRNPRKEALVHLDEATVVGPLHVSDRAITADGLEVRFGSSRVFVDFGFNFSVKRGWRLVARSDRFDLGDVGRIAGLNVAGRGSVTCSITAAPYGDPHIVGSAAFDDVVFAGVSFSRAEAGVRYADLTLAFDGLTVRGPRTVMSSREIALNFGGRRGLEVQAKIEVEKAAIEDLGRAFGLPLARYGAPRGSVYGRVAVDYEQRHERLRIAADLDHDEFEIFGERFGNGAAAITYDDGNLTVDRFDAKKGDGAISLTGAVFADGAIDIMGIAREVPIGSIDYEPVRELGIEGDAQVFVVLGGTLDRPKGTADVRVDDAVRRGVRYGMSHLAIEVAGPRLVGTGTIGDDLFTLEHGVLDLGTRRFDVEGFAYDLDVIRLLELDTHGQRLAVNLTGELAIRGRLGDVPGITGRATLNEVRVQINDFRFMNEKDIAITADGDKFRLRRARFRGDELVFDLSGRATYERMRLQIRGLADLGALASLVEPVTSSGGLLRFEGTVSGAWNDPRLYGKAQVEGGSAVIRGLPTPVEDVTGAITLNAKSIRFSGFSGRMAGGRVGVDGQLDLEGFGIRDYRFRASIDRVSLQLTEDLELSASTVKDGLLLRRGKRDLPYLTGDVEISDLRYTRDLRMIQISDLSLDRLTGVRAGTGTPKILEEKNDAFEYDVRLHGKRNLTVRNNLIDASLRIDDEEEPLRLVGTNQAYGFLGRVLGTKGQVRFQGQVFDLRYASLVFRDKLRPDNPYFRVTADGQVRDWRVSITAEGTIEDYKITITSQPYLSNEDLVFLLLTGMTKAERVQYGGSEIAPFSDLVSNVSGDVIPVDVRIYNEYSEKAGKDTTRISVGKQVTEDVWIALSSSVGNEREIEADLEYKINDNFSLFADYDNESQAGNLGVDLRFRLEF
jgi:translocation and assembly module TamB